jgi:uroporphyrinogen decarboxylase
VNRRQSYGDGAVFDILPDLLDAGVDMLEAVQTDAAGMDPQRLKTAFGDRLGFHGGISVQSLLPHGDIATVERECRRLVDVLGQGGGYIAAPSHAIQVGTPPENVAAMLRAVLGEEDFVAACRSAM